MKKQPSSISGTSNTKQEIPIKKFDEFLIHILLKFKNIDKLDVSMLEIHKLLDHISNVNNILGRATQHRHKLLALETLKILIDAVLKYFSKDVMTAIKPHERLVLIALLMKRSCFPILNLPARQSSLNLDLLSMNSTKIHENSENAKPKQNIKTEFSEKIAVKSIKRTDEEHTASINKTREKLMKLLENGIELDRISELSISDSQVLSLLVNTPNYELHVENNKIYLRKFESKENPENNFGNQKQSVSYIFQPKDEHT